MSGKAFKHYIEPGYLTIGPENGPMKSKFLGPNSTVFIQVQPVTAQA